MRVRIANICLVVTVGACAAEIGSSAAEEDGEGEPSGPGQSPASARGGGSGNTGAGGSAGGGAGTGSGGAGGATADGGRPAAGQEAGAPSVSWPTVNAAVVLSEIMYHPVDETTVTEDHEFVEIANRTDAAVAIGNWKLAGGGITYTFPAGATLPPRGYLAIAKNRTALLSLAAYKSDPATVIGDYAGELDNGGAAITLLDAAGKTVDTVPYNDKFPWPIAADSFGVGEDWLPAAMRPITKHRYMGHSLERISLDVAGGEVANWAPSVLDGATPGRANSARGTPLPVVETLYAASAKTNTVMIDSADPVLVNARLSPRAPVTGVTLEYFVDLLEKTDEPVLSVPMSPVTTMTGDADGTFTAMLPPQPDNAIVRYRVKADRGKGAEVVTPRPSDPFAWHSYFVTPKVATTSKVYHLFITPQDWTKLYDNIAAGANTGCTMNPTWQAVVPATFVFEGKTYDVRVRYQGSRFQRRNGLQIPMWTAPGPARPAPLKVLSLKVRFPKYRTFAGYRGIYLNKMAQGCPGAEAFVGTKLQAAAGSYGFNVDFARVHVNGAYYQYSAVFEEPRAEFFERRGEAVGDLFKVHGAFGDEALYGRGDGGVLKAWCGFTVEQRWATTYGRKTWDWKQTQEVKELFEGMAAAKAQGTPALRDYLGRTFDINAMLAYIAVRNWSGAWDDLVHNHYLYRKPSGKWTYIAWDYDQEFGGAPVQPFGGVKMMPSASFYISLDQLPQGGTHLTKAAFLTTYRAEYDQLLKNLSKTVLAPANVQKIVDDYVAQFNMSDWMQTPGRVAANGTMSCNPTASAARIKQWATDRHAALVQRLGM